MFEDSISEIELKFEAERIKERQKEAIQDFENELRDLCFMKLDTECDIRYAQAMKIVKKREIAYLMNVQTPCSETKESNQGSDVHKHDPICPIKV